MFRRTATLRTVATAGVAIGAMSGCSSSSNEPAVRPTDQPAPPVYAVRLTDAGCEPNRFTVHPGLVEFRVTNGGTDKVEEMEVQTADGHVVNDVEGVRPGTTRSFVVKLRVGQYRMRCPEDAPTGGTITVK
jgi:hypothetical protein